METVAAMAQDPGSHPLLSETRTLLPINELDVKAHAPVRTSTNNAQTLVNETELIRVMEGASGHYMGLTAGELANLTGGIAKFAGWSTFSTVQPPTMAHELGHNLGLYHAPCGNPVFLEIAYPGNGGSIGDWGYDLREPGRLLPPVWPDLMSYCRLPSRWIGSYHFTNALRFRLHNAGASGGEGSALAAAPAKSLLLWGGGVGVGAGVGGNDQPGDSGGGGLAAVNWGFVGEDFWSLVSLRDSHVSRIGGWKLSHRPRAGEILRETAVLQEGVFLPAVPTGAGVF